MHQQHLAGAEGGKAQQLHKQRRTARYQVYLIIAHAGVNLHGHIQLYTELQRAAEQMVAQLLHGVAPQAAADGVQRLQTLVGRAAQGRYVQPGSIGNDRLEAVEALVLDHVHNGLIIAALEFGPANGRSQQLHNQRLNAINGDHLCRNLGLERIHVHGRQWIAKIGHQRSQATRPIKRFCVIGIIAAGRVARRHYFCQYRRTAKKARQLANGIAVIERVAPHALHFVDQRLVVGQPACGHKRYATA